VPQNSFFFNSFIIVWPMDRSHLSRSVKTGNVKYTDEPYTSDSETFDNLLCYLEVFIEFGMGRGVRAQVEIKAGVLLGEYTGSIICRDQAISRMDGNPCHYVVATSYPNRFIDGEGELGNILKYVNHKCKNCNCKLVKLTKGRIGLQTVSIILPGESLNYNYQHSYFEGHVFKVTKCVCSIDCPSYF